MLFEIYLALGSFLVTLLGTRLTILALRKKQFLLDRPNARSNHASPTPRGGGIALVIALVIFLLVADAGYSLILALLVLAVVSLIDDLVTLPALARLGVQLVAVLLALPGAMDGLMFHGLLGPGWDKAVVVILWLWFINLFNFMDGIDGIAGAEMMSVSFGIVMLCALTGTFPDTLSAYALILLGAAAGFMWWNWHPAKIFLGDVGSIPCGFLLGYLLLMLAQAGYGVAALILPAYFLADSGITIAARALRGEKIWQAHSQHFYQKAVRSGKKHNTVVEQMIGLNILLIMLAVHATLNPQIALVNLATAYLGTALLLLFYARAWQRANHKKG